MVISPGHTHVISKMLNDLPFRVELPFAMLQISLPQWPFDVDEFRYSTCGVYIMTSIHEQNDNIGNTIVNQKTCTSIKFCVSRFNADTDALSCSSFSVSSERLAFKSYRKDPPIALVQIKVNRYFIHVTKDLLRSEKSLISIQNVFHLFILLCRNLYS